jgi:pentatricopeptide repeat-containing protein PET309
MLERTAGCLETGSLRRLLPGPRHSLKSRRTLHSGFWSHSAVDLELSPLWQIILRAADTVEKPQAKSPNQITSTANAGVLLDFLYPAGTIRLLRECSNWGTDRKEGKQLRLGVGKLGCRLFSSSAKEPPLGLVATGIDTSESAQGEKDDAPDMETLTIESVFGVTTKFDYEEVWRKYELLVLDSPVERKLRLQVLEYMSTSDRIVDAERVIALFERSAELREQPRYYESVVRSHLRLQNLVAATELYQKILENSGTPAGSSEIMLYLVTNERWPEAFKLWTEVKSYRYDSMKALRSKGGLSEKGVILAAFVNKLAISVPEDEKSQVQPWKEFAAAVIESIVVSKQNFDAVWFWKLLKYLRQWRLDTSKLYSEAIRMLLSQKQPRLAARLYTKARRNEKVRLPRSMVDSILKIHYDGHDVIGMQEVFSDYFRFNWVPSRMSYKLCMTEFARHGDAETVHAVFEQYAQRFMWKNNPAISADDIAPLLNVHAKRGEVGKVVEVFNSIEPKYELKPTILCYNILINAYAKAHEFDKAYQTFDTVLNSAPKVIPDDYTFGTVMGICSSVGDLENAVQVYKMSEDYNVAKSGAMISTLVTAFIQESRLDEAENICEEALKMSLKGSNTRMWNSLLAAWAMRYDLPNVNRILQRMSAAKVEYDGYTYAALMQALAMVGQPHRAFEILRDVMPQAGVIITSFHYAIIMGGFVAHRYYNQVPKVEEMMLTSRRNKTASTNFLALRAIAHDQDLFSEGTEDEKFDRLLELFEDLVQSIDPREMVEPLRKGIDYARLDTAYYSTLFRYMIYVFSKCGKFDSANELYNRFERTLPKNLPESSRGNIMHSLMVLRLGEEDYEAVGMMWDTVVADTFKKASAGLPNSVPITPTSDESQQPDAKQKVPMSWELALTRPLTTHMRALFQQKKMEEMIRTVKNVQEMGFRLTHRNWNDYIQYLAKGQRRKTAFKVCEEVLMPHWQGWARIRAESPVRNRLPLELRREGKLETSIRPNTHTFLCLLASYLEIQAVAAESRASRLILDDLENDCPRTLHALRTMVRSNDDLERSYLGEY